MTERPDRNDKPIIEASAREWTEKNASAHRGLVGEKDSDRDWFAERLALAAVRARYLESSEVAAKMAASLGVRVDDELLHAMDSFIALQGRIHRQTVVKWAAGWGPEKPFEDYARIETRGHRGAIECGIGMISPRFSETAEFLFLADNDRKSSIRNDGYVSRWNILAWENVMRTLPLDPSDTLLMTKHRKAEASLEAGYAASRQKQEASGRLSALVRSHERMPLADAKAVYDRLAATPEEAARIIMALTKAATHTLEAAGNELPETPDAGMLL